MALISLEDAKAQLNITDDRQDDELQAYIDGLTPVVEGFIGPVEPREVMETVHGSGAALALQQPPVLSLTSLTAQLTGGTSYNVAGLHLDGAAGIVRRLDGGRFTGGPWTAVYQAGRGDIPATVALAARILLQHLWRTQLPSRGGLAGGGDDYSVNDPVPGFGYAVPNRVLQLLEPYKQPPGVA
ncbi:phage head-tail connector protein [Streptomyces sp. NPDC014603]|uniref:phage head-tail connector protein n=1 Tax=Streptomyces sp. NPDC014603 TaxID=3364873 RepID=UPI003702D0A4